MLSEETLRLIDLCLERWRREEHEARLLTMNEGVLGATLVQAAGGGGVRDTTFLLSRGANVNYGGGYTNALVQSARNGHLAVVTALLNAGAVSLGRAFQKEASMGKTPVVALLLDRGVDIHREDDDALISSAYGGYVETTQLLLDRGANVHARNDLALRMCAIHCNRLEVISLLLDRGADVHTQNDEALRLVAEKGKPEVARLLLDRGADIHTNGDEALYFAARCGDLEMVTLLLDRGAHVYDARKRSTASRVIASAQTNGFQEVAELLKERGARQRAT